MILRAIAILSTLSAPAFAVSCPPLDGRPIARVEGGSLYLGDPSQHMMLAPDTEARTMADKNVWLTPHAAQITLVCRYEGTTQALQMRLPAETRRCIQDLAARSFACQ